MERLIYSQDTQKLLEELTEGNQCYWRYQSSKHGGLIPVAHQSHERMYDTEDPEYVEEGCSCYDNPYQLLQYLSNEYHDLDKVDVVLFVGRHMGYGLDEEDIVMVEEESDVLHSLSLKDFYKFCLNANIYWNGYNIKEYCDFDEEFLQRVYN